MKALLTIEWIRLRRSLGTFFLSIGLPVAFFLLFSATVNTGDQEMQRAFVRSYMLTMTGFSMSGFALFTFPMMLVEDRKTSWFFFIQHSPLPYWQYAVSKIFRVFLCFFSSILLVFAVGAGVRGVEMALGRWVVAAGLLLLTSLVFLGLGLLLSYIQSEQTFSVCANLLYFVLAILGGSWMPIRFFPDWLQTIGRLLPSYHANQLVVTYAQEGHFLGTSLLIVGVYAIIF